MIGVEKNANHKNLGMLKESGREASPEIPLWERRHGKSKKWRERGERMPILEGDWGGLGW